MYAFKANIKLLRCFWKFFCIVHVITIYTISALQFFLGFSLTSFRALTDPTDFQHTFYMTQGLRALPYNYRSNKKPLLAALLLLIFHFFTKISWITIKFTNVSGKVLVNKNLESNASIYWKNSSQKHLPRLLEIKNTLLLNAHLKAKRQSILAPPNSLEINKFHLNWRYSPSTV